MPEVSARLLAYHPPAQGDWPRGDTAGGGSVAGQGLHACVFPWVSLPAPASAKGEGCRLGRGQGWSWRSGGRLTALSCSAVLKLLKMAVGMRALLDTVMQALPQVAGGGVGGRGPLGGRGCFPKGRAVGSSGKLAGRPSGTFPISFPLFQVGNLGLLFMLLFFIFAALGVELFGDLGELGWGG